MSADLANPRTLRHVLSEVERQVRDDLWGDVRSFVIPEGEKRRIAEGVLGLRDGELWPLTWQTMRSDGRPFVSIQYNGWPVIGSTALPPGTVWAIDPGFAPHAFELLADGSVEPIRYPWAGRY